MSLHQKIQQAKAQAAPINYRALAVSAAGELQERESLLDKRIVEGYSVIWGSRNMHGEKFVKGAFAKSIREHGPGSNAAYEIKFTNRHGHAIGRFEVLAEDEIGLYFRTYPLDQIPEADNLLTQIKSRTINNFSVGFNPIWEAGKVEYDEPSDSIVYKEVYLFEMGAVDIPSDMQTFAIRSAEEAEELTDETELFIKTLPRAKQLEARQLFARHKSLIEFEPLQQRAKALSENEPVKAGIDYNYLLNNFTL